MFLKENTLCSSIQKFKCLKLASNGRLADDFTSRSTGNEHNRIDLGFYYNDTALDGFPIVTDTVNSIF